LPSQNPLQELLFVKTPCSVDENSHNMKGISEKLLFAGSQLFTVDVW
jgi:hypothetical protein